jgi:hypothetical protein
MDCARSYAMAMDGSGQVLLSNRRDRHSEQPTAQHRNRSPNGQIKRHIFPGNTRNIALTS